MYHLRVPQTAEELESYYQFRWEMLRKPLHQPKGSERDAWDAMAHHQMVVDEEGKYLGFVSKSKIFNSYRQVLVHFSED